MKKILASFYFLLLGCVVTYATDPTLLGYVPLNAAQLGSSSQKGIVQVDNVTIGAASGVISSTSNAFVMANPGNLTGTTSSTNVMGGMGSGCHITPTRTGNVQFMIGVITQNTTSAAGTNLRLYYGSGTAPTNGAATAGTQLGTQQSTNQGAGAFAGYLPVTLFGAVSGLTLNTAYWFDLGFAAVGGGTSQAFGTYCMAHEF